MSATPEFAESPIHPADQSSASSGGSADWSEAKIVGEANKYLPGHWRDMAYEHAQRGEHVAELWCNFLADVAEANPPNS